MGAVPSSLHQKLKFVIGNKVVSIGEEEDIIAASSTDTSYVEPNKGIPEPSFQSFMFINATYIKKRLPMINSHLSRSTQIGLKLIVDKGGQAEKGLRQCL